MKNFILYLAGCLKSFGIILLCTIIMVFFSERLFWTVFKPGDNPADQIMTLLAYMAPTFIFIFILKHFNIRTISGIFINGAIYGWLIEGGLTHTLYGTQESAVFPISVVCTSLSWHALITAVTGWYLIPRALKNGPHGSLKKISIATGVFWGLWAMFLWHETPSVQSTVPEFLAHASFTTLLTILSYRLLFIKKLFHKYMPGKTGLILSILLLGIFFAEHVKTLGLQPILILFPLIGFALFLLWKNKKVTVPELECSENPHIRELFYIPLSATLTYALALTLNLSWIPITSIVYYWLTIPLGTGLAAYAVFDLLKPAEAL